MRIYQGLNRIRPSLGSSAVTIGNFDGVHMGHRAILSQLTSEARSRKVPAVLITFDPHPVQILYPERGLQRLLPVADMQAELSKAAIDILVIEPFTRELSLLSGDDFLERHVLPAVDPRIFIVGHDFAFGAGRSGTLDFLKNWCDRRGVELRVQKPVEMDGKRISSRLIRDLITNGEVETARRFLGRPFYLDGVVERGAGRGKTISVPTMNVAVGARLAPSNGVYVTRTRISGRPFRSVSNLGVNPTFGGERYVKLETHVFDYSSETYGEKIEVEFLARIRDEKKFNSVEALEKQIREDIQTALDFQEPAE